MPERKFRLAALVGLLLASICLFYLRSDDIADAWRQCCSRPILWTNAAEFHATIKSADRIVLREGGFDCCQSARERDKHRIIADVTDSVEIRSVGDHIIFDTTHDQLSACMCCGDLGIDWHRHGKRIALTAFHDRGAIRWKRFRSGYRFPGCSTVGDAPLTKESTAWMKEWLVEHGVDKDAIKYLSTARQPVSGTFSRTDIYDADGSGKSPPITCTIAFESTGTISFATTREDKPARTSRWAYAVLPYRIVAVTMPGTPTDYCPLSEAGIAIGGDLIRGPVYARQGTSADRSAPQPMEWDATGTYTQAIKLDGRTSGTISVELRQGGIAVASMVLEPAERGAITGRWESTPYRILEYTQDNGWHGQIVWMGSNLSLNHDAMPILIEAMKMPTPKRVPPPF